MSSERDKALGAGMGSALMMASVRAAALEERIKQLEEALRKAVAQLESVGFDGHASGADKLLSGGPHDPS